MTSNDPLWVAFGVRSVVARVTTVLMEIDVVKDTMSAREARDDAS